MAINMSEITRAYNTVVYEWEDIHTQNWFMVQSPLGVGAIAIVYLLFVKMIGPQMMAKRPAYNLNKALIFINIFQIFANLWVAQIASGMWGYYMLKILDLADTVFFVLRKKYRQASFLHLYHHVSTLLMAWMATKYSPGGIAALGQIINALVHVIMFTYYFLAAMGPKYRRYLWWKRHLTAVQIVQLFSCVGILINHLLSGCKHNKYITYVYAPYITVMIILFMNFYIQSYMRKKVKET